jgi:hypothetical protein
MACHWLFAAQGEAMSKSSKLKRSRARSQVRARSRTPGHSVEMTKANFGEASPCDTNRRLQPPSWTAAILAGSRQNTMDPRK